MDVYTARAFLMGHLSKGQRKHLVAYESSGELPPGRCLQGFEICRCYGLKPSPLTDQEIKAMEDLFQRYEKTVAWKRRQIEEIQHEKVCGKKCVCLSAAEEMHLWEEWSFENYGKKAVAA